MLAQGMEDGHRARVFIALYYGAVGKVSLKVPIPLQELSAEHLFGQQLFLPYPAYTCTLSLAEHARVFNRGRREISLGKTIESGVEVQHARSFSAPI